MATDIEDLVIAEYKNYGLVGKLKFPLWDCEWKMEPHKKTKKNPKNQTIPKPERKEKHQTDRTPVTTQANAAEGVQGVSRVWATRTTLAGIQSVQTLRKWQLWRLLNGIKLQPGLGVCICNPITQKAEQEDHQFEQSALAMLGRSGVTPCQNRLVQ